jgi:hypothetical protein
MPGSRGITSKADNLALNLYFEAMLNFRLSLKPLADSLADIGQGLFAGRALRATSREVIAPHGHTLG